MSDNFLKLFCVVIKDYSQQHIEEKVEADHLKQNEEHAVSSANIIGRKHEIRKISCRK